MKRKRIVAYLLVLAMLLGTAGAAHAETTYTLTMSGMEVVAIAPADGYTYADITEVTIPATAVMIADNVFAACTSLERFTVQAGNWSFSTDAQGSLYDSTGTKLIAVPKAFQGTFTVPATVNAIDESAFENCDGVSAVLVEGTMIGCIGSILPPVFVPAGATAGFANADVLSYTADGSVLTVTGYTSYIGGSSAENSIYLEKDLLSDVGCTITVADGVSNVTVTGDLTDTAITVTGERENGKVTLRFSEVSGAAGYRITRENHFGGQDVFDSSADPADFVIENGTVTFTDDSIDENTDYGYQVEAYPISGESALSNWIAMFRPSAPTPEPNPAPETGDNTPLALYGALALLAAALLLGKRARKA